MSTEHNDSIYGALLDKNQIAVTGKQPAWSKHDFVGIEAWSQRTSRELVRRANRVDMQDAVRMDANEGYFFAEDLTTTLAKAFDKKWPLLKARTMVEITPIQRGKRDVRYSGHDQAGLAKLKGPGATDMPYVTVSGASLTAPVRTNWIGQKYDIDDLEASAASGGAQAPIDVAQSQACRRGCEARYDLQLRFGDAGSAVTGLLNNAAVETIAVTNGDWLNAVRTDQQILNDCEQVFNKIVRDSMGVHQATRMGVDSESWERVTRMTAGVEGTGRSVLDVLEKRHPEIRFEMWHALDTASGASQDTGLGGVPQLVVWEDDSDVLWSGLAREASPEPPQQNLADFIVMWLQTVIPGVVITYPNAVKYVTNHHV